MCSLSLKIIYYLDTGGLFLWAQSLFVLAQLLTGGLLHVNELDPVRRYLPSFNRPRRAGRYSAFQVSSLKLGWPLSSDVLSRSEIESGAVHIKVLYISNYCLF